MSLEYIEIILVLIIVSVQSYVFARTYRQINLFKNIIPNITSLWVSKTLIPALVIESFSSKEILERISSYKYDDATTDNNLFEDNFNDIEQADFPFDEAQNSSDSTKIEIILIESDAKSNPVFKKILFSANSYLLRNRGAATDFNLLKDIVERNVTAVEEDINSSIGVPLYLGLMGTMIGIVISLFSMPDLSSIMGSSQIIDMKLDKGIGLLIGGVKIAMIASFIGLFFTILNSSWLFRGSRSFCEARKNDFYTFVQIELLPSINQGLSSILGLLQRNLLKFNDEFSIHLKGLTGVFDENRSNIKEQKELIDALNNANISEMAKYNVNVLKQLNISVSQFKEFNGLLANVTQFVENSQSIVNSTNELLERTSNFKTIADNIESNLDKSYWLMEFLTDHLNKLEEHKDVTRNAVADVGHSISEVIKELKIHILNSSDAVKQFTVDELEALKNTLVASKTNWANLNHLATLTTDVSQFKNNSVSQSETLHQTIENMNGKMEESMVVFEDIKEQLKNNSISQSELLHQAIETLNVKMEKSLAIFEDIKEQLKNNPISQDNHSVPSNHELTLIMAKTLDFLEQREKRSVSYKSKKMITSIKNLFKSNK